MGLISSCYEKKEILNMSFRKKSVLLIFALSIVLILAACANTSADAESDSLQRVKDAGKLTVVGSGGYPPFNYIDDNGDVIGFDVEVGQEIADRLGVELNYVTGEWSGLIEGLRNERYDGILGSMAITEERLESVNFTEPYYYSGAQLVVAKDSGITEPSEMEGKKIAVVTATNFEKDAQELNAELKLYDDDNSTLMELINGRVDGVITDRIVAVTAMSEMEGGDTLALAGGVMRAEKIGIAINKNDDTLLEAINGILAEMHEDGTLTKISEKWLGIDVTVE
jgi:polar amino acid transport system substrate-binding protein